MYRLAFLTLVAAASLSCEAAGRYPGQVAAPTHTFAETRTDQEVEGRPTFGTPVPILGTSSRLVPFSRETKLGWFSDRDNFREGGALFFNDGGRESVPGQRQTSSVRWHNAVVHDLRTGEQWTLLEQRGIISRFWLRVDWADERASHNGHVFGVTVTDSNGDGKLDDYDPIRALATDRDGRNPRFITPEGTRLADVHYDGQEDLAYLMVSEDADGDGEFSTEEAPRPYLYRFGENRAVPMLMADTVERIESALE